MNLNIIFKENDCEFKPSFGEIQTVSDGGFEEGYSVGYTEGNRDGYSKGHEDGIEQGYENGYNEGLAARTYETWTITYVDGTIEEKDVSFL